MMLVWQNIINTRAVTLGRQKSEMASLRWYKTHRYYDKMQGKKSRTL